jgi:hypothetical protein
MKKAIIKWFAGDPIKTAVLVFGFGIPAAIIFAITDSGWNFWSILLISLAILSGCISLFISLFVKVKREDLDKKGQELYDTFKFPK